MFLLGIIKNTEKNISFVDKNVQLKKGILITLKDHSLPQSLRPKAAELEVIRDERLISIRNEF